MMRRYLQSTNDWDVTEAMAGRTTSKHKTGILWMFRNEEGTIRSVGTPTDTGEAEWTIGQMWHCLAKETASSFFRLLGDLVSRKRYARPLRAIICQLMSLHM